MTAPIWQPDPSAVGETNVGRFQAAHGLATFDELLARSIDDPAWFWGEVATFLGIPFSTPYDQVLDTSDGIAWARWFTGGRTNLAAACVDRWAAATPDAEAVRWEGEDGEVRVLTYAELARHVDGLAALLRSGHRRGRRRGHLPADAGGDRGGGHGRGQARRHLPAGLLRLRRRCHRRATRRRRGQGAPVRRRLLAAGQAGADARHREGGGGGGARRRDARGGAAHRGRGGARRGRLPLLPWPEPLGPADEPVPTVPVDSEHPCSSPTPRAPPAGPRARSTCTAASR
ncbi:MAG: acetyl-coenzyme A synthetase N-terminal domain-containing protein [Acidimicrobiales bacterium]